METRNILLLLAGSIFGGLAIRKLFNEKVTKKREEAEKLADLEANPWLLKTAGFDSYAYYTKELQYNRHITDPSGELNFVSTDMLANAMANLKDEILTTVQMMYRNNASYDNYFDVTDTRNPYWQNIRHAIDLDAQRIAE